MFRYFFTGNFMKHIGNYGEHLRNVMIKHDMWEAAYVQTCSNKPMWDDCTKWPIQRAGWVLHVDPHVLEANHIIHINWQGGKVGYQDQSHPRIFFRMDHHLLNHPRHLPIFPWKLAQNYELLCHSPGNWPFWIQKKSSWWLCTPSNFRLEEPREQSTHFRRQRHGLKTSQHGWRNGNELMHKQQDVASNFVLHQAASTTQMKSPWIQPTWSHSNRTASLISHGIPKVAAGSCCHLPSSALEATGEKEYPPKFQFLCRILWFRVVQLCQFST